MCTTTNLSPGQIGPIKFVCDGVYTAEGITPAGEKIYFAIETIEKSDSAKWESYRNSAQLLVNGGCYNFSTGSLAELGSVANDADKLAAFLKTKKDSDFWTSDPKKFEKLCTQLQERNITVDSPKAKELSTIPHASNGVNVSKQTHMVYVSKSPVTKRVDFVESKEDSIQGIYAELLHKVMNVTEPQIDAHTGTK